MFTASIEKLQKEVNDLETQTSENQKEHEELVNLIKTSSNWVKDSLESGLTKLKEEQSCLLKQLEIKKFRLQETIEKQKQYEKQQVEKKETLNRLLKSFQRCFDYNNIEIVQQDGFEHAIVIKFYDHRFFVEFKDEKFRVSYPYQLKKRDGYFKKESTVVKKINDVLTEIDADIKYKQNRNNRFHDMFEQVKGIAPTAQVDSEWKKGNNGAGEYKKVVRIGERYGKSLKLFSMNDKGEFGVRLSASLTEDQLRQIVNLLFHEVV